MKLSVIIVALAVALGFGFAAGTYFAPILSDVSYLSE